MPVVPARPVTAGATVDVVSVERWNDDTGAYEAVEHTLRPGGLLRLRNIGTHRGRRDAACRADAGERRAAPGCGYGGRQQRVEDVDQRSVQRDEAHRQALESIARDVSFMAGRQAERDRQQR